eukprot:Skav226520  [mRNA]  locus=scaffold1773:188565:189310:+ [translate_table: standard]
MPFIPNIQERTPTPPQDLPFQGCRSWLLKALMHVPNSLAPAWASYFDEVSSVFELQSKKNLDCECSSRVAHSKEVKFDALANFAPQHHESAAPVCFSTASKTCP